MQTAPGTSYPLGATVEDGGVNFSVFAKHAMGVDLLLFDRVDAPAPSAVIALDPRTQRTYHYWHAFVPGLKPGQLYGYRAAGLFEPEHGLRFDPGKVLLDPYGRCVAVPDGYNRLDATRPGDNSATAMKSVVANDPNSYDWEGDLPLQRPFSRTVIYEMHVRGFTRHPSSGVAPERRGTYAGVVEKIPYLRDLGISAVELLPVFAFDAQDCPPGVVNYWGYQPIGFFAPHQGYSSRREPLGALDEFRDMVKALHRAGIEVILDVVFNHTAEGGADGPTLSFRGLADSTYYILGEGGRYADYSGCANTLNANQPIVRRLIVDSLRYWVYQMHVDGFRFDLAAILSRDEEGNPLRNPPVLWDIESDPVLAGTKLIAEAWDAAGLYQVGTFVGDSWKEWNGRFRDDVRSFVKSDNGIVGRLASRLVGSPDIYGYEEREPEQSINFVTCHDGFTLNDLVSYDEKHNEANGEENRDGANDNNSWNSGVEGPTDDPAIEGLRNRQVKNLLTLTLTAIGAPMILMGDEMRRTQGGNNNGYCHDDELTWLDWMLLQRHRDVHRFVKLLIAGRLQRGIAREDLDPTLSLNQIVREARIEYHGVKLYQPDWGDGSHTLAITARGLGNGFQMHLMMNAYWEPLEFEIPPTDGAADSGPGGGWRRWIDTARASPDDISTWGEAPPWEGATYVVQPRSVVVLLHVPSGIK
jgi:glycogen operon protein